MMTQEAKMVQLNTTLVEMRKESARLKELVLLLKQQHESLNRLVQEQDAQQRENQQRRLRLLAK